MKRTYIYFQQLLFLKPIIDRQVETATKNRKVLMSPRKSNRLFNDRDVESLDDYNVFQPSPASGQFEEVISSNYNSTYTPTNHSTHTNSIFNDEIDEDKHFLLSLVPTLKRMNTEQKLAAKVEILNVLRNFQISNSINMEAVNNNNYSVTRNLRKKRKKVKEEITTFQEDLD